MKIRLQAAALVAAALSFVQAASAAAVVVPLTAQRSAASLPDGSTVPMWGFCNSVSTTVGALPATLSSGGFCSAAWTVGPTITIGTTDTLEIDLTNTLAVPTSIVILGQTGGATGGELGSVTRAAGPAHTGTNVITFPAAGGTDNFIPPSQGTRALSFAAETAAVGGTHQYLWSHLKPGTYIYEAGSRPSLQVPMGLYGTLVVTQAPSGTGATFKPGDAYPSTTAGAAAVVPYDADVSMLFSEIDPLQNTAVDVAATAHGGAGAWEMTPSNSSACAAGGASFPCYPPAVNYSPRFFLVNGQSFDPTNPQSFAVAGGVSSGNLLVRLLNAGSRTHVPTVTGTTFALMAEDGNLAPGKPKIQSEALLTAGKTYDVLVGLAQTPGDPNSIPATNPAYKPATLSVFDRALNLTTNNTPFGGMQALIRVNGAGVSAGAPGGIPTAFAAHAVDDVFTVPAGGTLSGNVRTNDFGVTSVALTVTATAASGAPVTGLTLNPDGSLSYAAGPAADTIMFTYSGNTGTTTAKVTITVGSATPPVANNDTFTSRVATAYTSSLPGVLGNDTDAANLALAALLDPANPTDCASLDLKSDGSFTAAPKAGTSSCSFKYFAVDSQKTQSAASATATIIFPTPSGITVAVLDTQTRLSISSDAAQPADYSWIIEQDMTFLHSGDPKNAAAANTLSTNFHNSYMPVVATGCTGPSSCGDNNSVNGVTLLASGKALPRSFPGEVALDFSTGQRYYLSVVPADAPTGAASTPADTTVTPNMPASPATIGHGMGGVSITAGATAVTVLTPQNPLPVANLSVFVFEDHSPTNGDVDEGEAGLGGFQVNIFDVRGSSGDAAGQMTYDLAGMPLRNGLLGQPGCKEFATPIPAGTIYTCPNAPDRGPAPTRAQFPGGTAGTALFRAALLAFQAQIAQDAIDYKLAGMALVPNMIPGRVTVEAIPNAARSIAGEKWIQVSTLEGGKPVDTFVKAGEPAYWQEFGAPGFHSFIGFMNPDHVAKTNAKTVGGVTLTGVISSLHMDRPPAANLNDSCATTVAGQAPPASPTTDSTCRAALSYTQCYVALNTGLSGTGENVGFTQCDDKGNFTLTNVPPGNHELVIWDQWLDQIIAKKAVKIATTGTTDVGRIPVFSWFTRVEQSAYLDLDGNGLRDPSKEPGLSKVPMLIRFRDGSISNFLSTDGDGKATANELFPLFNWYVIESDTTRYKGTGVNVVYDSGGKPDSTPVTTVLDLKGNLVTKDYSGVLNSTEKFPLGDGTNGTINQQVPGAIYTKGTTIRIDPGSTLSEGLQGFINQTAVVDWGKTPYLAGETGGITGLVYYASTRGFDDPSLEVQFSWEPAIPHVPVNLYAQQKNGDGTVSLIKIDSTTTSSWDDAALNIHCPGQGVDPYSHIALGDNLSKCYDGQHVFNQVQPAVYDGRYRFPTANLNPKYINANGTLKPGSYVVEVTPPAGYEIVKEESKNILTGEPWNALGQTQFLGLGNIFILPDQATLNSSNIPGGRFAQPSCVGAMHTVPDYLTLFSDNQQYAPFAGQDRPLCDRKAVALVDQTQSTADFQLFTPAPVAAHFVGIMLNDAAAEFDPISPSFGEKAALPNAPIAIRDFNGVEILRTYNDKWGSFNGLAPSTLAANVPNPSGYSPNMLTTCMNDPGPILDTRIDPATGVRSSTYGQLITDPMYNPMFSNFCYVWPFMPGSTVYLDTPVLPTAAFASASTYQPVDCQYPDATPAVKRVDGPAGHGPWISAARGASRTITITALGDADVLNPAYAGPTATTTGTNSPKTIRHYGFGSRGTVALRRTAADGTITATPIPMTNVSWGPASITADVPAIFAANDTGELIITNGDSHLTSVDTVTVSVENVTATNPTIVNPSAVYNLDPTAPDSLNYPQPIQTAIDKAKPGDLIILEAGHYPELVVMWKPVRLQGVGAASVIINATKFPNRKVADWRGRVNGLFGVDPIKDTVAPIAQVSPLPGQTLTGGIVLLEPTVLSTEEGAGITVLASDGARCPASFIGAGPTIAIDSTGATTPDTVPLVTVVNPDPSWSNFSCKGSRSSIDGITVTGGDSGGGIYVNGWAHKLQIANNRVYGNAGPFSGGVRIGQPYLEGAVNTGIESDRTILGYNTSVNIHHNAITTNGMVEGNAAAGATAAGGAGGGLSMCSGTDNYKVNYNFICGNFASSDGGGVGHIGLSNNGTIAFNQILFNESYNQTSPQNGGGLIVEGETTAGGGVSPGSGDVTIDANVIQGNFARAGSGGGIRLQDTNGSDLPCQFNDDRCARGQSRAWRVKVTNNIIVNNLAGSAGGGISLYDSYAAIVNNNTVASNDSTGLVGNLFNTVVGGVSTGPVTGVPGPAGIVTEPTSAQLLATLPVSRRSAFAVSNPVLTNDIVWQNRSFFFDGKRQLANREIPLVASNKWSDAVTNGGAPLAQQNATGQCVAGAVYWDMGVLGDQSPQAVTAAGTGLHPSNAVVTPETLLLYAGNGNISGNSSAVLFTKQYCNGSRVLPGVQFEPGTPFQPSFQLDAAATLDESGNFVDLHFGPISQGDPITGISNGDYHLPANTAPAFNAGVVVNPANDHDVDNQVRPRATTDGTAGIDAGADQFPSPAATLLPTPVAFGNQRTGTTSAAQTLTYSNTGSSVLTAVTVTLGGANPTGFAIGTNTCTGATVNPGDTCAISVTFSPTAAAAYTATLQVTATGGVTQQTATLTGTGVPPAVVRFSLNATPNQPITALDWGNAGGTRVIRVTNIGGAGAAQLTNLTVAIANLTGRGQPQFTVSASTCNGATALANNQSCTVTVARARPAATIPVTSRAGTGTLTLTDSGAATTSQVVNLTGG